MENIEEKPLSIREKIEITLIVVGGLYGMFYFFSLLIKYGLGMFTKIYWASMIGGLLFGLYFSIIFFQLDRKVIGSEEFPIRFFYIRAILLGLIVSFLFTFTLDSASEKIVEYFK